MKGVLETSFIHKILPSAAADLFYILLKKQKIKTHPKIIKTKRQFNKPNHSKPTVSEATAYNDTKGCARVGFQALRYQRNTFMLF